VARTWRQKASQANRSSLRAAPLLPSQPPRELRGLAPPEPGAVAATVDSTRLYSATVDRGANRGAGLAELAAQSWAGRPPPALLRGPRSRPAPRRPDVLLASPSSSGMDAQRHALGEAPGLTIIAHVGAGSQSTIASASGHTLPAAAPQFLDKNRRDVGESQPKWTAEKMGTPTGCLNDAPCLPFTRHGASINTPLMTHARGGLQSAVPPTQVKIGCQNSSAYSSAVPAGHHAAAHGIVDEDVGSKATRVPQRLAAVANDTGEVGADRLESVGAGASAQQPPLELEIEQMEQVLAEFRRQKHARQDANARLAHLAARRDELERREGGGSEAAREAAARVEHARVAALELESAYSTALPMVRRVAARVSALQSSQA
jgi:hypothetical protein